MSKRVSKAYDLSYEELKAAGFYYVNYDVPTNSWDIRRKWRKNNSNDIVEKNIKVSTTNDEHPYGKTWKAPIISFSTGARHYCISFPRFIYAWKKGFISKDKKLRRKPDLEPQFKDCLDWWCWEEVDMTDHSYYEKSNAVMCLKKQIEDYKGRFQF